MAALVFDLYLCQPVLVARTEPGDENSAEGLAYIPGSSLRGAFIALRLAQLGRKRLDLQIDQTEKGWFFDEQVFFNAYPTHPNGERMLPTPLSWRVEKDFRTSPQATIIDLASGSHTALDHPAFLADPFCILDSAHQPQLLSPTWFIEIHNSGWTRRVKGEGDSQVFRYEALAPGQTFSAAVTGPDPQAFKAALGLKDGLQLSIGRSRGAHYGRVELRNVRVVSDWTEAPSIKLGQASGSKMALILTSDAILYDNNGQPTLSLQTEVGVPSVEAWYRTRQIGGFNRVWGQPLPQSLAIQAGSVFVFPASSFDQAMLDGLVKHGIGHRRIEGYGHLRAAWLVHQMQRKDLPYLAPEIATEQPPKLNGSREMAKLIGEQYLKRLLEKKLAAVVANLTITNLRDRAQLSRLRIVVRSAVERKDFDLLKTHLADLKSSAEKISQARITQVAPRKTGDRLDDWMQSLADEADSDEFWKLDENTTRWCWQHLMAPDQTEQAQMIGITPDVAALRQLKQVFTGRLIDGVLRKATREIQRQQRREQQEEASHGLSEN